MVPHVKVTTDKAIIIITIAHTKFWKNKKPNKLITKTMQIQNRKIFSSLPRIPNTNPRPLKKTYRANIYMSILTSNESGNIN